MLVLGFILTGYIFLRGILPTRLHWRWKVVLTAVLAFAAFKFHLLSLVGGPQFFSPALPRTVLILSAWLFSILFLYFFLMVAADVVRGLFLLWMLCARRKRTERFRTIGNRVNLTLLLLSAALATMGIGAGTRVPNVREETVVIKNLPEAADGLTIAVLADLHADSLTRADRIGEIVRRTNEARPDVVVIVGDFVDGRLAERGRDLQPLGGLSARYGVFGVPGNHEYYSRYDEWKPFFTRLGIRMLDNEHVHLRDCSAVVAGVTDTAAARFGLETPDVGKAVADLPDGTVRLFLAHQPKFASRAAGRGLDLQISGHTHGGMVIGMDWIVARFNDGFVRGLYKVGDMQLYVARGSGIWSGFPVRIGVPSEIALLRLRKGD